MRKVIDKSKLAALYKSRSSSSACDSASDVQLKIAKIENENHLLQAFIDQLQQQAATLH
jgi:hypothetical protein